MGEGEEAGEEGGGITGVSSAPVTHNESGLVVSFDNNLKKTKAKKQTQALIVASHTPPWLASGSGCRGRRLSRA
jgi:hypothetical protein